MRITILNICLTTGGCFSIIFPHEMIRRDAPDDEVFFISIYTFSECPTSASLRWGLIVLIAVLAVMTLHINYEEDIAKFLPRNEQKRAVSGTSMKQIFRSE
jgi:hypothetical protein